MFKIKLLLLLLISQITALILIKYVFIIDIKLLK